MTRIFESDGSGAPVLIGHRGMGTGVVRGHAENTVASFLAAIDTGLRWVEVDARRTADGQLVACHNATTPDGAFVIDRPAAATGLPLLRDVLDAVPPHIGVDVDVKTEYADAVDPPDRHTAALLTPVLATERLRRRLCVTSFDPAVLVRLRDAVPGLRVGLIGWIRYPLPTAIAAAAGLGMDAVCLDTRSFTPDDHAEQPGRRSAAYAIETAHRAGLEVMVWCPAPEEAGWFARAGADALVINDPDAVHAGLDTALSGVENVSGAPVHGGW